MVKLNVYDWNGEKLFIDATLEEVSSYFNLDADSIGSVLDLEDALKVRYDGMATPTIEVADEMTVYANGNRAIMVSSENGIIKAAGLTNVLCCDADALIETEELQETDSTNFDWCEEI